MSEKAKEMQRCVFLTYNFLFKLFDKKLCTLDDLKKEEFISNFSESDFSWEIQYDKSSNIPNAIIKSIDLNEKENFEYFEHIRDLLNGRVTKTK